MTDQGSLLQSIKYWKEECKKIQKLMEEQKQENYQELDELQQDNDKLQNQLNRQKDDCKDLRQEIDELRKQLHSRMNNNDQMRMKQLEEDNLRQKRGIEQLQDQVNRQKDKEREFDEQEMKQDKMLKEIKNLRERIKQKSLENEDMRTQLESQEIEMGTFQTVQNQKQDKEQKVKVLLGQIEKLTLAYNDKDNQQLAWQERFQEVADDRDQKVTLQSKLNEANEQLMYLDDRLEQLIKDNKKLKKNNEKLQSENFRVTNQLLEREQQVAREYQMMGGQPIININNNKSQLDQQQLNLQSYEQQIQQLEGKLNGQRNSSNLQPGMMTTIQEVERYFLERESEIDQEYLKRKNTNNRDNGGEMEKIRLEQALIMLNGEVQEVDKRKREAEELKEIEFRGKEKLLYSQIGSNQQQYQQMSRTLQQEYKSEMDRINQICQSEMLRIEGERQELQNQLQRVQQTNQVHFATQQGIDQWYQQQKQDNEQQKETLMNQVKNRMIDQQFNVKNENQAIEQQIQKLQEQKASALEQIVIQQQYKKDHKDNENTAHIRNNQQMQQPQQMSNGQQELFDMQDRIMELEQNAHVNKKYIQQKEEELQMIKDKYMGQDELNSFEKAIQVKKDMLLEDNINIKQQENYKYMAKSQVGDEKLKEVYQDHKRILELLKMERERNQHLEQQLDQYNERMENTVWREKRKTERELREEVREVGKMGRSVQDRLKEAEEMKEEHVNLKYEIELLKNNQERLESQIQQDKIASGNRIRDSTQRVVQLTSEVQRYKVVLQERQAECEQLLKQIDNQQKVQGGVYQKEIERLQVLLEGQMADAMGQNRQQNIDKREQIERVQLREQVKQMKGILERKLDENEDQKIQIQRQTQLVMERQGLERDLRKVKDILENKLQEIDQWRERHTELEGIIADKDQQYNMFQRQQTKLGQLESELQRQYSEYKKLNQEKTVLVQRNQELEVKYRGQAEVMEELEAVRKMLDQKIKETDDAKKKNQRLEIGNDQKLMEEKLWELENRNGKLLEEVNIQLEINKTRNIEVEDYKGRLLEMEVAMNEQDSLRQEMIYIKSLLELKLNELSEKDSYIRKLEMQNTEGLSGERILQEKEQRLQRVCQELEEKQVILIGRTQQLEESRLENRRIVMEMKEREGLELDIIRMKEVLEQKMKENDELKIKESRHQLEQEEAIVYQQRLHEMQLKIQGQNQQIYQISLELQERKVDCEEQRLVVNRLEQRVRDEKLIDEEVNRLKQVIKDKMRINEELNQEVQTYQIRMTNIVNVEQRAEDYQKRKLQFTQEVERLNKQLKDKIIENDEVYQQRASAELRLKDQQLLEHEMVTLQNILRNKLEENDRMREELSGFQMEEGLKGVSGNDRQKVEKMFQDLKNMTGLLEGKNEENEGLKTQLVRLQDNEQRVVEVEQECARLREQLFMAKQEGTQQREQIFRQQRESEDKMEGLLEELKALQNRASINDPKAMQRDILAGEVNKLKDVLEIKLTEEQENNDIKQELQDQLDQYKVKINRYTNVIEEIELLQKRLEERGEHTNLLLTEIERLNKIIEERNKEVKILREKQQELQRLKGEINEINRQKITEQEQLRQNMVKKNKKDEDNTKRQIDLRIDQFRQIHAGELERLKQKEEDLEKQLIEMGQENKEAEGIKEKFISLQAAYDQRGRITTLLGETEGRLARLSKQNKELLQEIDSLSDRNKQLMTKCREMGMQNQNLENKDIQMKEKVQGQDFNQLENKQKIQQMTRQLEENNEQEKVLQDKINNMQKQINFCNQNHYRNNNNDNDNINKNNNPANNSNNKNQSFNINIVNEKIQSNMNSKHNNISNVNLNISGSSIHSKPSRPNINIGRPVAVKNQDQTQQQQLHQQQYQRLQQQQQQQVQNLQQQQQDQKRSTGFSLSNFFGGNQKNKENSNKN